MGTRYGELTESERRQIFLRLARISRSEIGRMIGRDKDKGTISRESRRNALLKSGYPNCISLMTLSSRKPLWSGSNVFLILDWLELVLRQIKAVEAARDEVLTKAAPANEAENTILAPARLQGIGPWLATLPVREAYVRPLRNRRALGAYLPANFPYRRRPQRARSNCVNCAPG